MMETYKELKKRHGDAVSEFLAKNTIYAFGKDQFADKLKTLGITEDEFKQKYVAFWGGGAILESSLDAWKQLVENQGDELRSCMKADKDFAKQAFNYEMSNYECFISGRFNEALSALGLSFKSLEDSPELYKAFKEAKKEYWDWCIENC